MCPVWLCQVQLVACDRHKTDSIRLRTRHRAANYRWVIEPLLDVPVMHRASGEVSLSASSEAGNCTPVVSVLHSPTCLERPLYRSKRKGL